MENKLKVVIPTDFTVQGDYAFVMVNNLAEKLDMDITFLHVLGVPDTVTMDSDGNIETCGEIDVDFVVKQKEMAEEKLNDLQQKHGDKVKTELILGKVTTGVIDYAEKNNFDLIVMGTKGASGLTERVIGSEAQVIARKSNVPVLSLMCDRSGFDLQKIVVVNNYSELGKDNKVDLLTKIQASFNSEIHLLQITDDFSDENVKFIKANMDDFAENNGISNYKTHVLKDEDIENGVIHFNQMNNMDMVCIGTRGKGGFFHNSAAESLINHMYKPVISYRIKS